MSRIAEEYEFQLTLPESLDQPISFKKSMTLERLVKHLTRGMNTVLKHKNVAGCATPVLTHLIVLPVGKESGIVGTQQSAQEQPVEYIYIDDMESYVRSVLEGKQQPRIERMTPEQREEYKMVRDALTSKLEEEAAQTGDTNNIGDSDTGAANQASGETSGN